MYLAPRETAFTPAHRVVDRATRAAKIAEIWKQLAWLEDQLARGGGPYLAGAALTHADMTWHPTCVFFEYMLPSVFGWPESLFSIPPLPPGEEGDITAPTSSGLAGNTSRQSDHRHHDKEEPSPLPHITAWYRRCVRESPAFAGVRGTILAHWRRMDAAGQFDPIREEVRDAAGDFKWRYP